MSTMILAIYRKKTEFKVWYTIELYCGLNFTRDYVLVKTDQTLIVFWGVFCLALKCSQKC